MKSEELKPEIANIYDTINFNDRYLGIVNTHNSSNYLEKTDKDTVLDIFKELGYDKAKYRNGEKFYQIKKKEGNYEFYFHTSLKYGAFELVFGAIRLPSKEHYAGGATIRALRKYRKYKGLEEIITKKASFGSYDELKEILQKALPLYEDFKNEILKMKS